MQIRGRGRQVRAAHRARLLALRVPLALSAGPLPPAHPAGPRAFWVVTAGPGAPAAACAGLFWGALGHGRARCELVVVGHCNAVNNHLDDV